MKTFHLVILAWALALAYVAVRFPITPMDYNGTEVGVSVVVASVS